MVLCCSVGTLKCSTTTSLSSSTSVWAPSLFRWDGQSGWAARLQERRKPGSVLPCSWTHRGCVEMSANLQQTLSQTAMYTSIVSGFLQGGFLFQELLPATVLSSPWSSQCCTLSGFCETTRLSCWSALLAEGWLLSLCHWFLPTIMAPLSRGSSDRRKGLNSSMLSNPYSQMNSYWIRLLDGPWISSSEQAQLSLLQMSSSSFCKKAALKAICSCFDTFKTIVQKRTVLSTGEKDVFMHFRRK